MIDIFCIIETTTIDDLPALLGRKPKNYAGLESQLYGRSLKKGIDVAQYVVYTRSTVCAQIVIMILNKLLSMFMPTGTMLRAAR